MSDDIVARLRQLQRVFGDPTSLAAMAADEVERLRLEVAIPRDEYAREWKNLLDRIEHLDILEWIRAYASAHSPSDYVSPIAREVIVRTDKRLIEAAAEIDRLRAERDKATKELCKARRSASKRGSHGEQPKQG